MKKNSCSFDSFITIYINTIKPNIEKYIGKNKYKDNYKYILYNKLIYYTISEANNNNQYQYFYNLLDKFNSTNKCNLFELCKKIEKFELVPIVINYKNFYNMNLFCRNYKTYKNCLVHVNLKMKLIKLHYHILL